MATSVTSTKDLQGALHRGKPVILHFWASWCGPSQQMDEVFAQLSADTPHATFLRVEAEEQPQLSEQYGVNAVPYFVFLKENGEVADTLEGLNPAELAHKVAKLAGPPSLVKAALPSSLGMSAAPSVLEAVQKVAPPNVTLTRLANRKPDATDAEQTDATQAKKEENLNSRLTRLVNSSRVMVFMKGEPEEPRCGFSRKVVTALKNAGVEFGSFDILKDEQVRQGLKSFSNWPTFPQVYSQGELVGGCDIVLEMERNGELEQLKAQL